MWMKIARWYEWIFGTLLLGIIGVVLSLNYFNQTQQWILYLGLLLFFIASLTRFLADKNKS